MTCRLVVGLDSGTQEPAVRAAALAAAPEGSEVLPAVPELPGVVVLRIPFDAAPEGLLTTLRAIPGVSSVEQERIYQGFGGLDEVDRPGIG